MLVAVEGLEILGERRGQGFLVRHGLVAAAGEAVGQALADVAPPRSGNT